MNLVAPGPFYVEKLKTNHFNPYLVHYFILSHGVLPFLWEN